MKTFIDFLYHLKRNKISYELGQRRDDYIMVNIQVPGARYGVEFAVNGEIIVDGFGRIGDVGDVESAEIYEFLFSDSRKI